jgi:hypothetical protein
MLTSRTVLVAACVALGSAALPALACGFAESTTVATLWQHCADGKIIFLGKIEASKGGPDGAGTTDIAVLEVLKTNPALGDRKTIRIDRYVPVPDPKNPPQFLLFADVVDGKVDVYRGIPGSKALVGYVKGLLAIDAEDRVKLMRFAFDYLDHGDAEIAADALNEFMTSPDPDIRTAARGLAPEKLRRWLRDEKTTATRLRLYGYLLGNCGDKDDAKLLRELADRFAEEQGPPLFDGILTGYVLLDPKAGWAYLRDVAGQPAAKFMTRYSALRAARYFQTTHPGVVTAEQILGVVSATLKQDDIADIALDYLREWKNWKLTDEVLATYGKKGFEAAFLRRSIVRYALQCPDPKAAKFVAELRKQEPELVEKVEETIRDNSSPIPEAAPALAPAPKEARTPAEKAVARGLEFLVRDAADWRKERTCATCHHGTMTVWALTEAKARGYPIDAEAFAATLGWTKERLKDIDKPRDTRPGWSMVSTPAVYLATMALTVPKQDAISADELRRIAGHLVRHQEADGCWAWSLAPAKNRPPPVFESDEVVTLLASAALDSQVPPDAKEKSDARDGRDKALAWLAKAKPNDTTQAEAVRLYRAARAGIAPKELQARIGALLARQNKDGGWGQLKDAASDAYATGQALYFLSVAGVTPDREEVRRGVAFLVSAQKDDGSWPMTARSHPGETPAKNAVPITYFGSAWGTLGLLRSAPK